MHEISHQNLSSQLQNNIWANPLNQGLRGKTFQTAKPGSRNFAPSPADIIELEVNTQADKINLGRRESFTKNTEYLH